MVGCSCLWWLDLPFWASFALAGAIGASWALSVWLGLTRSPAWFVVTALLTWGGWELSREFSECFMKNTFPQNEACKSTDLEGRE
jgi:hypothetical protein